MNSLENSPIFKSNSNVIKIHASNTNNSDNCDFSAFAAGINDSSVYLTTNGSNNKAS